MATLKERTITILEGILEADVHEEDLKQTAANLLLELKDNYDIDDKLEGITETLKDELMQFFETLQDQELDGTEEEVDNVYSEIDCVEPADWVDDDNEVDFDATEELPTQDDARNQEDERES